MPDELPPDPAAPQPDDESPDDALGAPGESSLASLLDQAASLAAELNADLGPLEAGNAHDLEQEVLAGPGDVVAGLEAELGEMERLALETGTQLGVDPKIAPHTPALPAKPASAEPRQGNDVPDFMSEFTKPAEREPAGAPEPESENVPDFMAEFTRPEPGAPKSKPPAGRPPTPAAVAPPGMEDMLAGSPSAPTSGKAGSKSGGVSVKPAPKPHVPVEAEEADAEEPAEAAPSAGPRGISGVLIAVGMLFAGVLDLLDRPFARLGARTKHALGLIGIATIATTLLVLARALF